MRPRLLALAIALGALTAGACESATDPIVGRSPSAPPRPDTTSNPGASAMVGRGNLTTLANAGSE